MIEKLRKKLKVGEIELPNVVKRRVNSYYFMSVLIILVGLILSILFGDIAMLILPLLISIIMAISGRLLHIKISQKGYCVITGQCEKVNLEIGLSNMTKRKSKRTPRSYIIKGEDSITKESGIYEIPYLKNCIQLSEGDLVILYTTKPIISYEFEGIIRLTSVLGYDRA